MTKDINVTINDLNDLQLNECTGLKVTVVDSEKLVEFCNEGRRRGFANVEEVRIEFDGEEAAMTFAEFKRRLFSKAAP